MVSVSVRYLFISQWMKRSKHGLFVFPPKKTLIWRRHCSIGQSCCIMTSKRSIAWILESSKAWSFFLPERSLKQPKATRVCFRLINQSNRSIPVGLLFLFSLRVFMSRSYENSLRKHLFLLALRRWGRFARMKVCDSATEIPYRWRKICPESGQKRWLDDGVVTLF